MIASASVIDYIHTYYENLQVGVMYAGIFSYPQSCHPDDVLASQKDMYKQFYFTDIMCYGKYNHKANTFIRNNDIHILFDSQDINILKKSKPDFLAFSYYMTLCSSRKINVGINLNGSAMNAADNPYLSDKTPWGVYIDPNGLRYAANLLYERYQLPLFIVENGLGTIDKLETNYEVHDDYRIEYLKKHILAMESAINQDGVPIIGYTPWSAIDIISAGTGEMNKRYGFIYIDADNLGNGTYKRYKKDSFYWYRKVISTNGADLK